MVTTIYINEKMADEFIKVSKMDTQSRKENGYQTGFSFTEKEEVESCLTAAFTAVVPVEGEPYGKITLFKGEEQVSFVSFSISDKMEEDYAIHYRKETYYILIRIMKEFADEESAKEYAAENLGKYEFQKRKSEKIRLSYVEPVFRMRMSFISLQMKCSKSLISWIWILPHSGISSLKYLKNIAMPRFIEGCDEF